MISEEDNIIYKNLCGYQPDYISAFQLVSNFVGYGMVLYDYHYELTELAYDNDYGYHFRQLICKLDNVTEEAFDLMYDLMDRFIEYLEEENRTADITYLREYLSDEAKELDCYSELLFE